MKTVSAFILLLVLTAAASAAGPTVTSVSNSASLLSGPIAPGERISILGSGFATSAVQSESLHLPTTLADVSVTIDGTAIGLVSVSGDQITAVAPAQLTPNVSHQLVVMVGSALSAPFKIAGGSTATVYFTGGGQTNPAFTDSTVSSLAPLAQNPLVLVGNSGAPVSYTGLVPSLIGFDQVKIQIPPVSPGALPISVNLFNQFEPGIVSSQSGVTIAVATTAPGTFSVQPSSLVFTGSGSSPAAQTLSVSSSGGAPIAFNVAVTTASGGNWLRAQTPSGITPTSIVISADPTGLVPNTYTGTVSLVYATGKLSVPVTFFVNGPVTPSAQSIITTIVGTSWSFPTQSIAATAAPLGTVSGAVVDSSGNIYLSDSENNTIDRITPNGTLDVIAGNRIAGFSGDGGPATSASLNGPRGLALGPDGSLYIADTNNNRIRKVAPDGTIITTAGNGGRGFSGDNGSATSATLFLPYGVAVDSGGNTYIADSANSRIRMVAGGVITTVAGNGSSSGSLSNGPALSVPIEPTGITLDAGANMYISSGSSVLKVSGGQLTVLADVQDVTYGVAVDAAGNVFTADAGHNHVWQISNGKVILYAGVNAPLVEGGFSGDGQPATAALLSHPQNVALDGAGNVYVADTSNRRLRKIEGGIINTIAGNGGFQFSCDGGPAASASLQLSLGSGISGGRVFVDASGSLYVSDTLNQRVRKITGGVITTVAGQGGPANGFFSGDGGAATSASFARPSGLLTDSAGNLIFADSLNSRIREVSAGTINSIAGSGTGLGSGFNGGFSGDGGPATSAQLSWPNGLAQDTAGALYVADSNNGRIRKISGGIINTFAGGGNSTASGISALTAALVDPVDVAVDSAGNVYIANAGGNTVHRVSGSGTNFYCSGHGADRLFR